MESQPDQNPRPVSPQQRRAAKVVINPSVGTHTHSIESFCKPSTTKRNENNAIKDLKSDKLWFLARRPLRRPSKEAEGTVRSAPMPATALRPKSRAMPKWFADAEIDFLDRFAGRKLTQASFDGWIEFQVGSHERDTDKQIRRFVLEHCAYLRDLHAALQSLRPKRRPKHGGTSATKKRGKNIAGR